MIFSVYDVAAAVLVVRLTPSARLVGITSGNSATNSPATPSAIVTKVPRNPQPSRPRAIAARPASSATAASTKNTAEPTLPVLTWVQPRNATATTAAARPTRRA